MPDSMGDGVFWFCSQATIFCPLLVMQARTIPISWEKIFEEIEFTEVSKEMKMFHSILN